ncbi:conserved hypothetical protein [Ricinus communis]|uniref:Uncharacterized protein n=1 Tax=Ricinus communis TaxID=3988 RepID=B9TBY4_RICCO|nr:conserved hypothetical protein [Ricinus communis]
MAVDAGPHRRAQAGHGGAGPLPAGPAADTGVGQLHPRLPGHVRSGDRQGRRCGGADRAHAAAVPERRPAKRAGHQRQGRQRRNEVVTR